MLLSILMVVTALPLSNIVAFADDSSTFQGYDVTIAVPETVYMDPQSDYYTKGTKVEYYVNNNVDADGNYSIDNSRDATAGTFSVYSDDIESLNDVTVNGATISGLQLFAHGNYFSDDSFTLTLNDGISSAETKTLEWTIKCTLDSETQLEYKAYTVAYAPYIAPVVSAVRTMNGNGKDIYCQTLNYISGIHGLADTEGDYYCRSNLLPVADSIEKGTGKQTVRDFFSADQTCNLPDKTVSYYSYEDNHQTSASYVETQAVSPVGGLTVDKSRYTNLNQVPNFTIGFSITDTENTEYTCGYFAEFDPQYSYWKKSNGMPDQGGWYRPALYKSIYEYDSSQGVGYQSTYKWVRYINNFFYGGLDDGDTTMTKIITSSNSALLLTNVLWDRSIPTGSQTIYTIAGARAYQDKDNAVCDAISRVNIFGIDKSSLRDAVMKYESYGLKREQFGRKTLFDNYQAELKDAATRLGDPTIRIQALISWMQLSRR